MTNFSFSRVPSTKVSVAIEAAGLVAADNTLMLIGRLANPGGTAAAGDIVAIENTGDPTAAQAEVDAAFGAGSELGEMVLAAINGVLYSDLDPKLMPAIKCLVLANVDTSASLAASLAAKITTPMPFAAVAYKASDAPALTAFKAHLVAISASDRGDNGQFGSFGFMALDEALGTVTPITEAAASENVLFPWLRDSAGVTKNKAHEVAAATAAVCAAAGIPYLPLNGVKIGGLEAPDSPADHHTAGDSGSEALGLASGALPLMVGTDGSIKISRTVTSSRRVAGSPDDSYFDLQDWQKLYYLRKNIYVLSQQKRYRIAHATDQKFANFLSESQAIAKAMEKLEMTQHVDDLADQWSVRRLENNRHAAVVEAPVNIVPGFHNKGIGVAGVTTFDAVAL